LNEEKTLGTRSTPYLPALVYLKTDAAERDCYSWVELRTQGGGIKEDRILGKGLGEGKQKGDRFIIIVSNHNWWQTTFNPISTCIFSTLFPKYSLGY